jgi:TRAP-type C4-dicarboxylate transport system permease small subunit
MRVAMSGFNFMIIQIRIRKQNPKLKHFLLSVAYLSLALFFIMIFPLASTVAIITMTSLAFLHGQQRALVPVVVTMVTIVFYFIRIQIKNKSKRE